MKKTVIEITVEKIGEGYSAEIWRKQPEPRLILLAERDHETAGQALNEAICAFQDGDWVGWFAI